MARPLKEGLEYFPLDCDIDQDDKMIIIEAQHGLIGFGIAIKLLMKIYNNSYFYEWTEREQILFSKRVNVDINTLTNVINDLIKWGFFDKELFINEKILTSSGVQKRYLEATLRRKKVKMLKKYLLLDDETVNSYKNLVIVDINPSSDEVNGDNSTQSKVKESKVKESKGKEKESSNNSTQLLSLPTQYHEQIFNKVGQVSYRTWFENTSINEVDNILTIEVSTNFSKNTIESRYKSILEQEFGKEIIVKENEE